MRTFKQYQKEMEKAHDCKKCNGKIFAITIDHSGNKYCAYCGTQVHYPYPTIDEMNKWKEEAEHEN